MKRAMPGIFFLATGWLLSGCATTARDGGVASGAASEPAAISRVRALSTECKLRLLALNPQAVTEQQVREVLSQMPAPRIISIHGGVLPIESGMNSFARFLMAMGYPETSLRNPATGQYAYGYYESSRVIAGIAAWYYERDGLRPMIVGHSQGGIQTVRVLHQLAGDYQQRLPVVNPHSQREEPRYEIVDPLTGTPRPVVGLRLAYATAALAGGLARLLPNQWDMAGELRQIPDSVEEFTGFQKGLDPLGGDWLGYGSANEYHPTGSALVRNVRLPSTSAHWTLPYAASLLQNQTHRDWISRYHPGDHPMNANALKREFGSDGARVLWVAEVWHGIKKHWVLELQRLVRAQQEGDHDS